MNATEHTVEAAGLSDTFRLAAKLADGLAAGIRDGSLSSVFVGLDGDLGAGKTTFVQGFVAALGGDEDVTSPTFSLVHIYPTEPPVTHMDLYRLGGPDDLEAIGYRDYYFAPGITLVEWSERAALLAPESRIQIALAVRPTDVREIQIRAYGDSLQRIVKWVLA